jgi:N-acetylglucosaminyl-diphospho-decaprenol L-rhamnosyltransferase
MRGARVGVVTVAYESGESLDAFLASIPGSVSEPVDVVVVENASPGAADARAAAERHGARFLPLEQNRGYGGGVNAGVEALEATEFVLVSNPDTVLSAGALDKLVARGRSRPDAAALGPLVRDANGAVYPSARRLPSLREGLGHAFFVNVWPMNPWTRAYRQAAADIREREAGWLSGSCVLVRRDVFEELGGFDESYFMYFEDVDLGARITGSGRVNLYVPDAEVTHTGAHSTRRSASRMRAAHHDSAYRYLSRRYTAWYLWPLRVALRVGLGIRKRLPARGAVPHA